MSHFGEAGDGPDQKKPWRGGTPYKSQGEKGGYQSVKAKPQGSIETGGTVINRRVDVVVLKYRKGAKKSHGEAI